MRHLASCIEAVFMHKKTSMTLAGMLDLTNPSHNGS